mmetsp:Transcript_50893/g.80729  ORF Transcript_50893/g.80729 Transcript_50893/m.80729 type:complete len:111 (+) Transcript_50893:97-429(+)
MAEQLAVDENFHELEAEISMSDCFLATFFTNSLLHYSPELLKETCQIICAFLSMAIKNDTLDQRYQMLKVDLHAFRFPIIGSSRKSCLTSTRLPDNIGTIFSNAGPERSQ